MNNMKNRIKKVFCSLGAVKCMIELILFRNRVILFEAPYYGNIGDQAILLSEIEFLRTIHSKIHIIDISAEYTMPFLRMFKNLIRTQDVILIQGGGFFGSLWKDELYEKIICSYPNNRVVIFPQTIFYEKNEYGEKRFKSEKDLFDKENVIFFVREKQSYDFSVENLYKKYPENCRLVPDVVLSYNTNIESFHREKVIFCLREDKEKVISENLFQNISNFARTQKLVIEKTDICVNHALRTFKAKRNVVQEKLNQFASAKFVVTDRLHCMIFCTLVGTPCIAMDNSSKKVKGVYEKWLKDLDYIVFCENENDALSKAQEWIKADSIKATRYSPKDLESAFAPLTQAIKDCLA